MHLARAAYFALDRPIAHDLLRAVLQEQIAKAQADRDPEVVAAAQALLEQVKAQPGGQQVIHQVATGSYIAQAAGEQRRQHPCRAGQRAQSAIRACT